METITEYKDALQAKKKVFLGGTCGKSTWRDYVISKLNIDYFNPVVDDWNEEAYKKELEERENCDFCLYTITPHMEGVYSIAEVVDDSNKRPEKTILCVLEKEGDKKFNKSQLKSLKAVGKTVQKNGGKWFEDLDWTISYLNGGIQVDKNGNIGIGMDSGNKTTTGTYGVPIGKPTKK